MDMDGADPTPRPHAQPFIMARQVFGLAVHDLAQPVAHFGRIDVVVVNPALVARVIGRVDIDALNGSTARWN
jgi:hypothetical protein